MALPQGSFVWGPGGVALTPEQIALQREILARKEARGADFSPVGDWTQGAARVVDALGGVLKERRLDKAESAGKAEASSLASGIDWGSLIGGGAYPASVAAGGSPTAPAATGVASGAPSADAANIKAGLVARGLPEHVADGFVMNFQDESGLNPGINEQNPTVPGSRGGYGLYQLTGPRRVAYENFAKQRGVNPADTDAQLDFLVSELQGPEAGAAKSIFAAPDAGTAAAAIATNFLRPNAKSLADRVAKYTSGAPVQTASLDPSIGMEQAVPDPQQAVVAALQPSVGVGGVPAGAGGQPVLDVTQVPQLSEAAGLPFQGAPQASPGVQTVSAALGGSQGAPQASPAVSRVSEAMLRANDQALGGIMAPEGTPQPANAALGGAFPAAPDAQAQEFPPAPQNNPQAQVQQLVSVINHPFASREQKMMASQALEQIQTVQAEQRKYAMQQNDPANRLDMQYKQAQLDALRNPPAKAPQIETLYDENGNEYKGAWNPTTQKYDRVGGSKSSLMTPEEEAQKVRLAEAGASKTNINTGEGMKLTESQSKDLNFFTRGIYANDELQGIEDQLTNAGQAFASNIPGGNYLKSPEFRMADRAGREVLAVILRKDSGAAITDDEMARYGTIYLPQPGDDAATITAKRDARERAVNILETGLGNANPLAKGAREKMLTEKEAKKAKTATLPEGVTEDDITETMRANNMTREQVLEKLNGRP